MQYSNESRPFGTVFLKDLRGFNIKKMWLTLASLMEENAGTIHAGGTIIVCAHDNAALIDSCVRLVGIKSMYVYV